MQTLCLYLLSAAVYFTHYGRSQEVDSCLTSKWLTSLKMSLKILKAGFHRELQYSIAHDMVHDDVTVLLVQKMPSGVYMDEYQLANLREDTGLEVLLDSKVDLEAPEYLSAGFTALVFLSSPSGSSGHQVTVPIHARYHRPSDSGPPRVKVDIESPRLLIRSDRCEMPVSSHAVDAPCTLKNVSMCSWLEIWDFKETGPVSLEVPVGDATQTIPVCVVTVLVTLLSCAWILRAMWKHSMYHRSQKNK